MSHLVRWQYFVLLDQYYGRGLNRPGQVPRRNSQTDMEVRLCGHPSITSFSRERLNCSPSSPGGKYPSPSLSTVSEARSTVPQARSTVVQPPPIFPLPPFY